MVPSSSDDWGLITHHLLLDRLVCGCLAASSVGHPRRCRGARAPTNQIGAAFDTTFAQPVDTSTPSIVASVLAAAREARSRAHRGEALANTRNAACNSALSAELSAFPPWGTGRRLRQVVQRQLEAKHRPSELYELPMSDVNWLALWDEFAQAIDNKQLEVAERIVYLDGRLDFTELSSSQLIAAARQIIRERVEER